MPKKPKTLKGNNSGKGENFRECSRLKAKIVVIVALKDNVC